MHTLGLIHILLLFALLFWLLALIPSTSHALFMPLSVFCIILFLIIGAVAK